MSRDHYKIYENAYPHFVTCTVVGWTAVFTRRDSVDVIFESLRWLQSHRNFMLFGYVILENHLHMIVRSANLAADLGDFKSFTARRIIDLLEAQGIETLLKLLRLHKARHKTDRNYQLWQEGSHPKQITNDEMLLQKLEYIRNNSVKRGYVDLPEHWRYSSARDYLRQPR